MASLEDREGKQTAVPQKLPKTARMGVDEKGILLY